MYFTLYAIVDIFSRYIVGWQVTKSESAAVARDLIKACCTRQRVAPGQLTIHTDRGSPMVAKSTAQLYVDLGIAKSHSRPHTSNDNPYSDSNFRTLKYRPDLPEKLGSINRSGLQLATVRNLTLALAWVLTMPISMVPAGLLFWVFSRF